MTALEEQGSHVSVVSTTQTSMIAALRDSIEKIEAWVSSTRRSVHQQMDWIDQGFAAIFDRERLLRLADEVQVLGDELSRPTNGKPVDDWQQWQADERRGGRELRGGQL